MRVVGRVAALLVGLLVVTSCGGGSDMSDGASQRLDAIVERVRDASEHWSPSDATAALADLRREVSDLHRAGKVSDERAAQLLSAAAAVESHLDLVPTTTTTTTTTTAPPAPAPKNDNGNGDNGNKGKGNDDKGKDD